MAPKMLPESSILKQLPPTLCNTACTAATGYSKVPRGLRFPLGIPGICTWQGVRRDPAWDSGDLVTSFMQAGIQPARHFATLSSSKNRAGPYLHLPHCSGDARRTVSEDPIGDNISFNLYRLCFPCMFISYASFTSRSNPSRVLCSPCSMAKTISLNFW